MERASKQESAPPRVCPLGSRSPYRAPKVKWLLPPCRYGRLARHPPLVPVVTQCYLVLWGGNVPAKRGVKRGVKRGGRWAVGDKVLCEAWSSAVLSMTANGVPIPPDGLDAVPERVVGFWGIDSRRTSECAVDPLRGGGVGAVAPVKGVGGCDGAVQLPVLVLPALPAVKPMLPLPR